MAVTDDKYSQDTLEDKIVSTGGIDVNQVYTRIPIAFPEYLVASDLGYDYEDMTDAQRKDDTGFRQKFFLDGVFKLTDARGNACAIGLLRQDGLTQNAAHHALSRRGHLGITLNQTHYIVPNDGGLNTMPHAEFSGNILAAYPNFVKVLCNLRSAYYIDSDWFKVKMYRTRAGVKTELYDFFINVGTDDEPTTELAEKETKTQFPVKYRGTIGGLEAGDILTLEISATNSEGTFTNSVTKSATVLAEMVFIQVYRHADLESHVTGTAIPDTIVPTNGTPYAMLISQDMYDEGQIVGGIAVAGTGGVLYRLFEETSGGDPMAGNIDDSERLQGAPGVVEDAYESTLSYLPQGYYYGVPTSWNGSTLAYVQVVNSNSLRWYPNQYTTADFMLTMSLSGEFDTTTQKYKIYVWAKATGVLPSGGVSVSTELHELAPTQSSATKLATISAVTVTSTAAKCLNENSPYETTDGFLSLTTYNTSASGANTIEEGIMTTRDIDPSGTSRD